MAKVMSLSDEKPQSLFFPQKHVDPHTVTIISAGALRNDRVLHRVAFV